MGHPLKTLLVLILILISIMFKHIDSSNHTIIYGIGFVDGGGGGSGSGNSNGGGGGRGSGGSDINNSTCSLIRSEKFAQTVVTSTSQNNNNRIDIPLRDKGQIIILNNNTSHCFFKVFANSTFNQNYITVITHIAYSDEHGTHECISANWSIGEFSGLESDAKLTFFGLSVPNGTDINQELISLEHYKQLYQRLYDANTIVHGDSFGSVSIQDCYGGCYAAGSNNDFLGIHSDFIILITATGNNGQYSSLLTDTSKKAITIRDEQTSSVNYQTDASMEYTNAQPTLNGFYYQFGTSPGYTSTQYCIYDASIVIGVSQCCLPSNKRSYINYIIEVGLLVLNYFNRFFSDYPFQESPLPFLIMVFFKFIGFPIPGFIFSIVKKQNTKKADQYWNSNHFIDQKIFKKIYGGLNLIQLISNEYRLQSIDDIPPTLNTIHILCQCQDNNCFIYPSESTTTIDPNDPIESFINLFYHWFSNLYNFYQSHAIQIHINLYHINIPIIDWIFSFRYHFIGRRSIKKFTHTIFISICQPIYTYLASIYHPRFSRWISKKFIFYDF